MAIKIITETASDVTAEIAKEYDIDVMPIEIRFGTECYMTGVNLTVDEFYEKLATFGDGLPKTSMINEFTFTEKFAPLVDDGNEYIVLLLSSNMSGTVSSARSSLANLNAKNIHIFDTQAVAFAQGAIVIETAKKIKTTDNIEEVLAFVADIIPRVRMLGVVSDLKYLRDGGRLSTASMHIANALHIKPIMGIRDGMINAIAKSLGLNKSYSDMAKMAKDRDFSLGLYFAHAQDPEKLDRFRERLVSTGIAQGDEPVLPMGGTVGTHTGAGCVGIGYFVTK